MINHKSQVGEMGVHITVLWECTVGNHVTLDMKIVLATLLEQIVAGLKSCGVAIFFEKK